MLAVSTGTHVVPIAIALVADQALTRDVLAEVLTEGSDIELLGATTSVEAGERLLDDPRLQVVLVNLSLAAADPEVAPGIAFIRTAKARRPDVGVLSLKRSVDEPMLRAALDAGAGMPAAWSRPPQTASAKRSRPSRRAQPGSTRRSRGSCCTPNSGRRSRTSRRASAPFSP